MEKYNIIEVDKTEIKSGDLIEIDGKVKTVCNNNIKYDSFMGVSIFGDSYKAGYQKVRKVINYSN